MFLGNTTISSHPGRDESRDRFLSSTNFTEQIFTSRSITTYTGIENKKLSFRQFFGQLFCKVSAGLIKNLNKILVNHALIHVVKMKIFSD